MTQLSTFPYSHRSTFPTQCTDRMHRLNVEIENNRALCPQAHAQLDQVREGWGRASIRYVHRTKRRKLHCRVWLDAPAPDAPMPML